MEKCQIGNGKSRSVELLAPARDYDSVVAAVDYGADAVYIGGARFGARQAAGNSTEQIARAVEYAHRYGVRIHATLNTLLWDDELADAERQARELIAAGIDALIVQDMALRRMDLPVELHASTQVSNRTPEGARFLGEAGFARVILERNLSLDEIRAICAATQAEVECFVHGAICVGYSGRCFLSRSMSGRSGNRGACSQPCRLTYDLTDGRGRTYLTGKHLLSVRDLNLSDHLGELLDAGVRSFKIEGRLKDTNYIRNVVAYYRQAVDAALASRLTYGTVQNQILLDWYLRHFSSVRLKKIAPRVLACLRMGLYQLILMDKIPAHAAVAETVALVKHYGHANDRTVAFANAVLRNAANAAQNGSLPREDRRPWHR